MINKIKEIINNKNFSPNLSGVHIHNEKESSPGLNLFDGKLMNNEGRIIKEFKYKYLGKIYKKNYYAQEKYEGKTWGKFDLNDKPIWTKNLPIHHEITFDKDKIIKRKKIVNGLPDF